MMDDLKAQAEAIDQEAGIGAGPGTADQVKEGEHIPAGEQPSMEGAVTLSGYVIKAGLWVSTFRTGVKYPPEVHQEGAQKFAPLMLEFMKRFPVVEKVSDHSDGFEFAAWCAETAIITMNEMDQADQVDDSEPEKDIDDKKPADQAPAPGSVFAAEAERQAEGQTK